MDQNVKRQESGGRRGFFGARVAAAAILAVAACAVAGLLVLMLPDAGRLGHALQRNRSIAVPAWAGFATLAMLAGVIVAQLAAVTGWLLIPAKTAGRSTTAAWGLRMAAMVAGLAVIAASTLVFGGMLAEIGDSRSSIDVRLVPVVALAIVACLLAAPVVALGFGHVRAWARSAGDEPLAAWASRWKWIGLALMILGAPVALLGPLVAAVMLARGLLRATAAAESAALASGEIPPFPRWPLAGANPSYITSMSSGLRLTLLGFGLQITMAAASALLTYLGTGAEPSSVDYGIVACLLGIITGASLVAIGWWKFTKPDPAAPTPEPAGLARLITRYAILITSVLSNLSTLVLVVQLLADGGPAVLRPLAALSSGLSGLALIVGFFTQLLYMRVLGLRMEDEGVVRWSGRLLWIIPLLAGPGAVAILGPPAAAVLWVMQVLRVRRGLIATAGTEPAATESRMISHNRPSTSKTEPRLAVTSGGYLIRRGNGTESEGPVTSAQVRALAAGGLLAPTDMLSKDGATWVRAAKVRGLTFGTGNSLA